MTGKMVAKTHFWPPIFFTPVQVTNFSASPTTRLIGGGVEKGEA